MLEALATQPSCTCEDSAVNYSHWRVHAGGKTSCYIKSLAAFSSLPLPGTFASHSDFLCSCENKTPVQPDVGLHGRCSGGHQRIPQGATAFGHNSGKHSDAHGHRDEHNEDDTHNSWEEWFGKNKIVIISASIATLAIAGGGIYYSFCRGSSASESQPSAPGGSEPPRQTAMHQQQQQQQQQDNPCGQM